MFRKCFVLAATLFAVQVFAHLKTEQLAEAASEEISESRVTELEIPGENITVVTQLSAQTDIFDSELCGRDVLLSIDDKEHIYIQPTHPERFNQLGLYAAKVLKKIDHGFLNVPQSLAFDSKRHEVYFNNHSIVQKFSICDPMKVSIVVSRSDMDTVEEIRLDLDRRIMIWKESDPNVGCRLIKSKMDGSNINILFRASDSCNAITLDTDNATLYWVQQHKLFSLQYSEVNFQVEQILQENTLFANQIEVYRGYLYWISQYQLIFRRALTGAGEKQTVVNATGEDKVVSFHLSSTDDTELVCDLTCANDVEGKISLTKFGTSRENLFRCSHSKTNKQSFSN